MASDLGLSCPRGGEWYICQGTKIEFVGCCTIDPCADGSGECAEANLLPASFSMNQYSKIPSLGCAPSTKPGYKQPLWWTCIAPVPPFMGCCHSNPCTDGCPEGNLSAARLPYEPSTREMFLTNANANVEPEKSSKLSSGAIAGIVVGAIAVIVALIGAYWFLRRKKQKKTAVENVPQTTDANGIQVSSYNKDSPNPNYSPHPCKNGSYSGILRRHANSRPCSRSIPSLWLRLS